MLLLVVFVLVVEVEKIEFVRTVWWKHIWWRKQRWKQRVSTSNNKNNVFLPSSSLKHTSFCLNAGGNG